MNATPSQRNHLPAGMHDQRGASGVAAPDGRRARPMSPGAPSEPLRVWFDHQRAARALQAFLEVTEPEGIPLLPVKGALLGRTLYADLSERPISDLDLRVRRADLPRLSRLCRAHGWPTSPHEHQWASFITEIASILVEVESSIGPPGLCAVSVEEMIARASRTTAGFGFPHLEPELNDHALLLCVNAFKDKIRYTRPSALGDLVRIAEQPCFDPARMAGLAERARLRTAVWLVADWAASAGGSAGWRAVRERIGRSPPRPLYVHAYRALMTTPRHSRLIFPILARVGSDDVARRAQALFLGGAGLLRSECSRAFRVARRRDS
jgi:hypothetical protein